MCAADTDIYAGVNRRGKISNICSFRNRMQIADAAATVAESLCSFCRIFIIFHYLVDKTTELSFLRSLIYDDWWSLKDDRDLLLQKWDFLLTTHRSTESPITQIIYQIRVVYQRFAFQRSTFISLLLCFFVVFRSPSLSAPSVGN